MTGIVTTYQLRLRRGPHERVLNEISDLFCSVERHLHRALIEAHKTADAEIAAHGGLAAFKRLRDENGKELMHPLQRIKNEIKAAFLLRFGITSRQYNSILRGLEARHDSLRELLKDRIEAKERALKKLEAKIAKRAKEIASFRKTAREADDRVKAGKALTKAQAEKLAKREKYEKKLFVQHNQKRRAQRLRDTLAQMYAEKARDIPPVVFGTKKLLRERAKVHNNDTTYLAAWRKKWNLARSNGFLIMGSKDEVSGCQTCRGEVNEYGALTLNLRLPNCLATREQKYLELKELSLPDFGLYPSS